MIDQNDIPTRRLPIIISVETPPDALKPLVIAVVLLALALGAVMCWNYATWQQPAPYTAYAGG